MSTHNQPSALPGNQETFSHLIEEDELAAFAGLVGANAIDFGDGEAGKDSSVPNLFMIGVVGGLLNTRFANLGSACINLHFEFLSPIHCGDCIETTIELVGADTEKHLATYRVDCYSQAREQVITGQAVMILPHESR